VTHFSRDVNEAVGPATDALDLVENDPALAARLAAAVGQQP
jgi:hypothetical protein